MNRIARILATTVAAATVFAALAFNGAQLKAVQAQMVMQKPKNTAPEYPDVEVMIAHGGQYQASVVGYGEARPHYALTLTSEVSGRVLELAQSFESGRVFAKGELLVELNDVAYRQAVASAESAVASANLALLEEQREGDQARLEWQRSGLEGEPDSSLVLRAPQLKAAKAELAYAKQQLVKAKQDLADTRIRAPFDAVVVSRDVQLGSYLQAGTTVATLNSTDRIEVSVPLSAAQWNNLPPGSQMSVEQWPVKLVSSEKGTSWSGYVLRAEQHLEGSSRQRSLVVALDKPLELNNPLYAGEFVEAHVAGKPLDNVWQLPASALSQDGKVWLVDQQGLLSSYDTELRFAERESIYIAPITGTDQARVVLRPLNSYVDGTHVHAIVDGGDA